MPVTANRLNQFHTETAHDEELSLLRHTVQCGWTQDICKVPKKNPAILDLPWRIHHRGWNSTERNSHYSATQLTSSDDPASTHWTPQIRKMPQQSQIVNVLAWTVWRIKRNGNKLYYTFKVQLTKANLSIQQDNMQEHEIPIHPWSKQALDVFHFEGDSYLLCRLYI